MVFLEIVCVLDTPALTERGPWEIPASKVTLATLVMLFVVFSSTVVYFPTSTDFVNVTPSETVKTSSHAIETLVRYTLPGFT